MDPIIQSKIADVIKASGVAASLPIFDDYLKNHPKDTDALRDRAISLMLVGKQSDAIRDFERLVDTEPATKLGGMLGNAYLQSGRTQEASREFDRELALEPNDPDALAGRANLHRSRGDLERAKEDFAKAASIEPNKASRLADLAKTEFAMKDFEKAVFHFDAAIYVEPTPELILLRGLAEIRLNRSKDAEESILQALKLLESDGRRP
jgi:tetratricopeptide (TPR) repeat protein